MFEKGIDRARREDVMAKGIQVQLLDSPWLFITKLSALYKIADADGQSCFCFDLLSHLLLV